MSAARCRFFRRLSHGCRMPAKLKPEDELRIVALSDAGEPARTIAVAIGCSQRTVERVLARMEGRQRTEAAAEMATAVRAAVVTNIVDEFRATLAPAIERHREFLQPGATPDPQQVRVVIWTLERVLPSADAKEQTRAANVSAERYAEAIKHLTETDSEMTARMAQIEAAQDAVVAARQPYIVSPPDQVASA